MSDIEYCGTYLSKGIRCGTTYSYQIRITGETQAQELAVLINHDGLNKEEARVMERLAETEEVPPCAVIGLMPGEMAPTTEDGTVRNMRFNDYDVFSSEYVDFIVDEFLPFAAEKHGLHLSQDPNMHMISGGSSGGISAWNGVWFRNDYFRRAYLSSPTFSAMARGNMAPVMIRLFETKPIRVYIDYSEDEPDDYFGNSVCAGMEGRYALEFAGYDYKWDYYPGEGHCSRYHNEDTLTEVMRFLWKDWKTSPVEVPRLSKRADALIWKDKLWEPVDRYPAEQEKARTKWGRYLVRGNTIVLERDGAEQVAAEGFQKLTAVAVSSDLWRLYAADAARACVYVFSIGENGTLMDRKKLSSLQTATDFYEPGAFDLCVDSEDRVYAATELGIQCIRSFGLVDVILPLPGNAVPQKVQLAEDCLYAAGTERIYCRKIKASARKELLVPAEPKHCSYYD